MNSFAGVLNKKLNKGLPMAVCEVEFYLQQRFQSADYINAINLLTSGLFTVNTMWTN